MGALPVINAGSFSEVLALQGILVATTLRMTISASGPVSPRRKQVRQIASGAGREGEPHLSPGEVAGSQAGAVWEMGQADSTRSFVTGLCPYRKQIFREQGAESVGKLQNSPLPCGTAHLV